MRNKENYKRRQILLWVFVQLHKQRVVELCYIEQHFKCHCEHIMQEAVLKGFFRSTSARNGVGWNLTPQTENMTTTDFQEELKTKYHL